MTDTVVNAILGGGAGTIATLMGGWFLILTEKLVPGAAAKRDRDRANRYEEIAIKAMNVADRATTPKGGEA
jgi:hypothetical protein